MKSFDFFTLAALALSLGACARSAVMPMSADTVQISTDAALYCGRSGAAEVALRRAAIETINRGFDKFVVLGSQSAQPMIGAPGVGTRIGNTIIFAGSEPTVHPSQTIVVKMFKAGEPEAEKALSAREVLGPKWQERIKESTSTTC